MNKKNKEEISTVSNEKIRRFFPIEEQSNNTRKYERIPIGQKEIVVLYEDNHILVVLKPANVSSQKDKSSEEDMLNVLKEYIKKTKNKKGNVFLALVHRLDKPTAGVMVFAKTSKAAERLCKQIREGDFKKKYLAILCKVPKNLHARLDNWLVKDSKENKVRIVTAKQENALKASLVYNVLEIKDEKALVDVLLLTGRPHQIRVQFSGIGCHILNDNKYGNQNTKPTNNLMLFAYQIAFMHPTKDVGLFFMAYPPSENEWNIFRIDKHLLFVKPNIDS